MTVKEYPSTEAIMAYAKKLGIQSIHTKHDPITGLEAIIAIHNIDQGPAIGGCRFQHYEHSNLVLEDAIELAYRMALKSAAMGLPHGGGKAVIRVPEHLDYNRETIFQGVGAFVEELNGDYIASLDAGTNAEDMDSIMTQTQHVIGATPGHENAVDPSIYTAYGVFRAMVAALEFKKGKADFSNLTVAIQGAGHVAAHLVNYLLEENAKIIITDVDEAALRKLPKNKNISYVKPKEIFTVTCDIFAPCALGHILDIEHINQLTCSMVIGAANNQLADDNSAAYMKEKGILYLPDFIVNAGGLISASDTYHKKSPAEIYDSVNRIYNITKHILAESKVSDETPNQLALNLAENNIKKKND